MTIDLIKMEELHMYIGEARKVQEAAAKMIEEGRTQLRNNRRPRWKEYTLIKYKDNKIESIEICNSKFSHS